MTTATRKTGARNAAEIIAAIRHQLEINVRIAETDHPEAPLVEGTRAFELPHSQDLLAQHIRDHLTELEAVINAGSPTPEGHAALHAHVIRKAAARERAAGMEGLASELEDAMRFVEHAAVSPDVIESAMKDGYSQALATYRPTVLLSVMQDAAMQADAALRIGEERHMARTLEAIGERLLQAASLRGSHAPTPDGPRVVMLADRHDAELRTRSDLPVDLLDGLEALAQAWRRHVKAVDTYNRKLEVVKAERISGDFSSKVDAEYRAMNDAQSAFIRTAQEVADAAARKTSHG